MLKKRLRTEGSVLKYFEKLKLSLALQNSFLLKKNPSFNEKAFHILKCIVFQKDGSKKFTSR